MTVDSLMQLKQFSTYTYAWYALRHWQGARSFREVMTSATVVTAISEYEMACELFLKHIISRTESLRQEHLHSHNVWALACDAELIGREKYRLLLKFLTAYYRDGRYETEDPEAQQAILDFFVDGSAFDQADELLFELYTLARDVDRNSTYKAQAPSKGDKGGMRRLNLFSSE